MSSTTSDGKNVFLIGPGFIGWNVLDLLVGEGYRVTTLARRESHAKDLKASGAADVIMGTLDDKELITKQATQADIIIHSATADHLPSVEAVLEGVTAQTRTNNPSTPRVPIFIHTSGTSVLDDGSANAFKGDKVYRDDQRGPLDDIPDSALHREIDLAIIRAQEELGEKAKFAIMTPPLIYGYTHGRLSIQMPILTRFAMKHGYAGYIGKGLSVESNIHVLDLARAYVIVLHALEKADSSSTSESDITTNPYWFIETTGSNEPSWLEIGTVIAQGLHSAGKIESAEVREIPRDVWGDLFGEYSEGIIGLNSRSRAVRLRALGWEPREKDWKTSYLEDELPQLIKEDVSGFKGYTVQ